jgi:signal transduction histidine kinase/CheY-like chemotaxis protein
VRIPVDAIATPILEGSDDVAGAVAVLRDCSERAASAKVRHKAEQDLQEARRLEGMGRLAGGLAHDFNNMLTAVLGNAELLGRELPPESEHGQLVRAIESSARAAARICQRLRDYAALQRSLREPIDLRALVDDTIELVRVLLGAGTVVRVDVPATLPVLLGDRVQLQQVLMNLLVNAAESIGDRDGQIVVRAGVAEVPPAVTSIPASLPAGNYMFLEVRDDGLGMTREVQERIFDPFFSTKQGGRGLGLPGVLGIVRGHRGGIRVDSAPGQGATFRILLPLLPEPVAGEPAADEPTVPPRAPAGRDLLIVDDDDEVRAIVRRLAAERRIACTDVADIDAALQSLDGDGERYGLVVVDLGLPRQGGFELASIVRHRWPGVRVLFTGNLAQPAPVTPGDVPLLRKPFTAAEFFAAVGAAAPHVVAQ